MIIILVWTILVPLSIIGLFIYDSRYKRKQLDKFERRFSDAKNKK